MAANPILTNGVGHRIAGAPTVHPLALVSGRHLTASVRGKEG